ncbi:hypothetical protein HMPREF0847_02144 [Streptococcus sp. 2_1_36FAA]|nr:hypothetical protein HMPREF0847_02144 [Streptococcus sp. 2_1_36FAA]SQG04137.1 Uncharacterised protein [Streptococcus gordonii]
MCSMKTMQSIFFHRPPSEFNYNSTSKLDTKIYLKLLPLPLSGGQSGRFTKSFIGYYRTDIKATDSSNSINFT